LSPSLTTVVQPFEQMCEIAWQFLQNRINDPSIPLQQITLKPQLVVRGSS
ncbi:MAG: substrate-binding domain-containing protein, partial [Fibrella sp.]|nr:substrate-binding domain-containing protein [Armatimonadota bacterium]